MDIESSSVVVHDGDPLIEDEAKRVVATVERAHSRGWDLARNHQWFICDEWEETEFRKKSRGGIRRQRYFDLRKFVDEPLPDLKKIAAELRASGWE